MKPLYPHYNQNTTTNLPIDYQSLNSHCLLFDKGLQAVGVNEIGKKIAELMEIKGLRVKDLSQRTGFTPTTIHRHLSGDRKPDYDARIQYAKAFDLSIEEFERLWQAEGLSRLLVKAGSASPKDLGAFTIRLGDDAARALRAVADARGESPEDTARRLIMQGLGIVKLLPSDALLDLSGFEKSDLQDEKGRLRQAAKRRN